MKLDVLDDVALRALSAERLIALAARVQQHMDTVGAYLQRIVVIAEQRKAARAVGDINTADSLVRTTGISLRRARSVLRFAETIATHPKVAGALAAGAINTEQAEAIARADVSENTRTRLLTAAVAGENADTTRRRTLDAETDERNETPQEKFMRQRSKRYLRFYNNRDGMVCMQGAMDHDTGVRVKAKITAIANRMWRQDKKQPPKHRRTPQQREIDALYDATTHPPDQTPPASTGGIPFALNEQDPLASTGAVGSKLQREGDPMSLRSASSQGVGSREVGSRWYGVLGGDYDKSGSRNRQRLQQGDSGVGAGASGYSRQARALPVVRVSTSLQDLKHGLRHAGVTDSGEHLSAETIRRMACDAQIIPTVLGAKSRIIDVGRRTRVISEALRIAVIHRDKHCVWPGCHTAPDRCDCHHVEHWADGGPTILDNLALLCHQHHILLHEAHYKLKRHNNIWIVLKPDKTLLRPHTTTQRTHPLRI